MNPKDFTIVQWINVASFTLAAISGGGIYMAFVSPEVGAAITSGIAVVVSVLNFIAGGAKTPVPAEQPAA